MNSSFGSPILNKEEAETPPENVLIQYTSNLQKAANFKDQIAHLPLQADKKEVNGADTPNSLVANTFKTVMKHPKSRVPINRLSYQYERPENKDPFILNEGLELERN